MNEKSWQGEWARGHECQSSMSEVLVIRKVPAVTGERRDANGAGKFPKGLRGLPLVPRQPMKEIGRPVVERVMAAERASTRKPLPNLHRDARSRQTGFGVYEFMIHHIMPLLDLDKHIETFKRKDCPRCYWPLATECWGHAATKVISSRLIRTSRMRASRSVSKYMVTSNCPSRRPKLQ